MFDAAKHCDMTGDVSENINACLTHDQARSRKPCAVLDASSMEIKTSHSFANAPLILGLCSQIVFRDFVLDQKSFEIRSKQFHIFDRCWDVRSSKSLSTTRGLKAEPEAEHDEKTELEINKKQLR